MSGRQQLSRRLLAQDDPAGCGFDQKRRVRLTTFELAHAKPAAKSVEPSGEPCIKADRIERVSVADLHQHRCRIAVRGHALALPRGSVFAHASDLSGDGFRVHLRDARGFDDEAEDVAGGRDSRRRQSRGPDSFQIPRAIDRP